MRTATATLRSVSPYSQSRYHDTPRLDKELDDDYERRTWREHLHVNDDGFVFIPPMAPKNCVAEAAQYLGIKVKGKRGATYTKHFAAGLLVTEPLVLPIRKEDVHGEWLFLDVNGRKGSGKRVKRCYPRIPEWRGDVTFLVLDELITEEVFEEHLSQAGQFIGIGRFRPRNGGFYGRFAVEKVKWS